MLTGSAGTSAVAAAGEVTAEGASASGVPEVHAQSEVVAAKIEKQDKTKRMTNSLMKS